MAADHRAAAVRREQRDEDADRRRLAAPLWPSRPRASPERPRGRCRRGLVWPKRLVRPSARTAGEFVSYGVRIIVRRTVTYTVRVSSDRPRRTSSRAHGARAGAPGPRRRAPWRGRAPPRAPSRSHRRDRPDRAADRRRGRSRSGLDAPHRRRSARGNDVALPPRGRQGRARRAHGRRDLGRAARARRILGDWRAALRAIAQRTRAMFERHPWLIDTAGRRPLVTPNQLRHVEQSIAVVAELDVGRDTAIAMVMAVDDYTIGHVFRRSRFGGAPARRDRRGPRARARAPRHRRVPAARRGLPQPSPTSSRRPTPSTAGSSGCSTGCRRCWTPDAGRLAAS